MQELHRGWSPPARTAPSTWPPSTGGELRAVLAELSRVRARQGFTATETAISVFALKDVAARARWRTTGDAEALRDFVGLLAR